jgi:hypothetical protein
MPGETPPIDTDGTDSDSGSANATDAEASTPSTATEHAETAVPDDRTAHRCPYCDRPFAVEARVTLHVGLTHYDVCTDAEAEAFEDAYVAETDAIKRYRLKAAALLIVVYFGFLMVYAVFGVAG